ncbi:MAG: arginase family protein [Chloroflexia bacterium]
MVGVHLLVVPYDSGQRDVRMGRGPDHLMGYGIESTLRERGHATQVEYIEAGEGFRAETGTSFELYRLLAKRVAAARQAGGLPLVLAGNCGSALGTLSGLNPTRTGVIWFDAHGDFNTPETSGSGFLDGMALAIATGRCWRKLAASIPGFSPVPEANVVHVGARDLDPEEKSLLAGSAVHMIDAGRIDREGLPPALEPAFATLARQIEQVYVHVDLDVLDPAQAPANGFSPPGGLGVDELLEAIAMIRERFTISAGALTAYDPDVDPEKRTLGAAMRIAASLAEQVG